MTDSISYHIVVDIYDLKPKKHGNHTLTNAPVIDYRLSDISLTSVNMDKNQNNESPAIASTSIPLHSNKNQKEKTIPAAASIEPLKAKYVGFGVIRLYREIDELEETEQTAKQLKDNIPSINDERNINEHVHANDDDDDERSARLTRNVSSLSLNSSNGKDAESINSATSSSQPVMENTMVSILAIPSYFTVTDILGFIGDEYTKNHISNVRIIRADVSNRFLVLLNFRSKKYAKKFKKEYNGKHFNSMEPETCHVIYVKSVIFKHHDSVNHDNNYFLDDPFTAPATHHPIISTTSEKPMPPPTPDLQELPTCPVCLERMDSSVTGLLTIPCQHTFHCQCLTKWKDDSCPICRYSSTRQHANNLRQRSSMRNTSNKNVNGSTSSSSGGAGGGNGAVGNVQQQDKCNICGIGDNLWICLVCGNIACGRYNHAHAISHYTETGHCFAMDVNSQRIWDYAGDNYVHRLLTTENDGKLVELPSRGSTSPSGTTSNDTGALNDNDNKNGKNSVPNPSYVEYSHILISQLESQREYYESKLDEMSDLNKSVYQDVNLFRQLATEQQQTQERLNKDIKRLESIAVENKTLKDENKKLKKDFQDEKLFSSGMLKRIEALQAVNKSFMEKFKKSEEEKQELKEQVRDLMFYLESQEKFKDSSNDVKEGTVVVQHSQQPVKASGKKKKKVKKLPPKELMIKNTKDDKDIN